MSYLKIWVHAVWSTKDRQKYLIHGIRPLVFKHIKDAAKDKDIFIDFINGYSDHAHALISLGKNQTLSDVMQIIKGESSHWINKNRIIRRHFMWQDDYYAVSVSPSHVQYVRNYIRNQESHHSMISWDFEIRCFMNDSGFEKIIDID